MLNYKKQATELISEIVLNKKKIFIIPSKEGILYFVTNFILFFMGLIYANNVVLLIAFTLISFFCTNMIYTHFNIQKLGIHHLSIQNAHAEAPLKINLVLNSQKKSSVQEINFYFKKSKKKIHLGYLEEVNEHKNYQIQSILTKRGQYDFKRLMISTIAPSGIFTAWRYWNTKQSFYIYPSIGTVSEEIKAKYNSLFLGNDRSGNFEYYLKDPNIDAKQIDWKIYAKSRQIYSKKYSSDTNMTHHFQLNRLTESEISQIATDIHYLYRHEINWTLRLNQKKYSGKDQHKLYKDCMEALSVC